MVMIFLVMTLGGQGAKCNLGKGTGQDVRQ